MDDPPPYNEQPENKETVWEKIYQRLPTGHDILLGATFITSIVENILYNYDPLWNIITSFGACGASNYIGSFFPRKMGSQSWIYYYNGNKYLRPDKS